MMVSTPSHDSRTPVINSHVGFACIGGMFAGSHTHMGAFKKSARFQNTKVHLEKLIAGNYPY